MSRRQGRPWQPMMRAPRIIPPALAAKAAADPRVAQIVDQVREVWRNDQYVVHVTRRATGEHAGTVEHLSIRRVDRAATRHWRHFQRIKDEIAGPDVEAVELYPARARVVDNANQYHLWCFPPGIPFPFGFAEGSVSARQQPPRDEAVWRNDQYVVHVTRRATGEHAGTVEHLSIRRVDRAAAQDWRHFQRIKDEIAGPDVEAVELYPARARVVDNANQYHLWCFPPGIPFPFGFAEGSVSSDTRDWGSARQRPLDGAWLAMTPGETARHGQPGQGYGTLLPAGWP